MDDLKFDQNEYLGRIKYSGEVKSSIEHLYAIHHAQFFTIPFENFDICLSRAINLEPDHLFQKLVKSNRGGYCFELNGLFLRALKSFGFEARALLARVHFSGEPTGRGHQISLVTIQGKQWIVDVGFGKDTPHCPIPLIINQPSTINGQTFRLVEDQYYSFMLQSKTSEKWEDLYSFDLEYVCPGDIAYGNHFTSTHPGSFFVSARVAALPIDNGVITLNNKTLKKTLKGKETQIQLREDETYIESLKTYFGIKLNVSYKALKPFTDTC